MAKVGFNWRILAWGNRGKEKVELQHKERDGVDFDELVIDDFLHVEKMSARTYWARIGDANIFVHKNVNGKVTVNVERGTHSDEIGFTITKLGAAGQTNDKW